VTAEYLSEITHLHDAAASDLGHPLHTQPQCYRATERTMSARGTRHATDTSREQRDREPEAMHIRLLGGFTVSVGYRTIRQEEWRSKKAASLVKLLALASDHRLHREQVMELLWPDSGKKATSNNLRQVLYSARRILDSALGSLGRYLGFKDEQLVLCPGGQLWVDVDAFEGAASAARRSKDPGPTGRLSTSTRATSSPRTATRSGPRVDASSCVSCTSRSSSNSRGSTKDARNTPWP